jgi:hypothetical protein
MWLNALVIKSPYDTGILGIEALVIAAPLLHRRLNGRAIEFQLV